ncbi:MAG: helix-turn-helix domain-containing protein [Defluviitaleaceae bacterium]|nr:helix-turn-helix domain-containing protein [Defluviitaleaceae bacterium]
MENDILNLEQAMELFSVSERTMIKLLREENVPARKIGREWRFSKAALLRWLGEGDSTNYQNHPEQFQVHNDSKAVLCDFVLRKREARSLGATKHDASNCLPCCPELKKCLTDK